MVPVFTVDSANAGLKLTTIAALASDTMRLPKASKTRSLG